MKNIPHQRKTEAQLEMLTMDMSPIADLLLDGNNNNNENVNLNNSTQLQQQKLPKSEKYSLRQRNKRTVEPPPNLSRKQLKAISKATANVPAAAVSASAFPRKPPKSKSFLSAIDLHNTSLICSPLSPTSSIASSSSSRSSSDTSAGKPHKEKPKTKAPPLSKYRRKTANARERTRMREINSAFENLRKCVPMAMCLNSTASSFNPQLLEPQIVSACVAQQQQLQQQQQQMASPTNEKLTKITTLKLAMKYIRMLTGVLNGSMPMGLQSPLSGLDSSETGELSGEGDSSQSSLDMNNNTVNVNSALSIKVPVSMQNKSVDSTNLLLSTCPSAQPSQQQQLTRTTTQLHHHHHHHHNSTSQPYALYQQHPLQGHHSKQQQDQLLPNANELLFGSPCLTPPIDDSSSNDLAMMLECSDAEAMRLAGTGSCLSPPLSGQNIKVSFNTAMMMSATTNTTTNTSTDDDGSLELGLLLESDSDSLQLSEPCLSPLVGGVLDPFQDLLNTGFSEQTVLDMYL